MPCWSWNSKGRISNTSPYCLRITLLHMIRWFNCKYPLLLWCHTHLFKYDESLIGTCFIATIFTEEKRAFSKASFQVWPSFNSGTQQKILFFGFGDWILKWEREETHGSSHIIIEHPSPTCFLSPSYRISRPANIC